MNLGQAVAVCLYELTRVTPEEKGEAGPVLEQAVATRPHTASGALDRLAEVIGQTMTAAGYSPRIMDAANRHDLRLLLRRIHLTSTDTKRALGVFRRILWRLTRSEK